MERLFRLPLILEPQPEGGFTVTSPLLPELLTEGDTVAEALENVKDALAAVIEMYEDEGQPLPGGILAPQVQYPIWAEALVVA